MTAIYAANDFRTPGIIQLSTHNMDDALRTFDGVLATKPTNLVALLGKVSLAQS